MTIQETEAKFPDKHLDSNGETSTSVNRTDLGNPVAQNDGYSPNIGTEKTDRGEKDKTDNGNNREDVEVKDKNSVEDLGKEGGGGVRDERKDNGNRKRKKEEEDEGGGLRSKEVRKENVADTEEKEDQISERVGKGDGDGNRAGKEDGVTGRENRGEVGNGKNRGEGEDEEGRPRSDPLLRSSANGSTSTSDPLVAIPKNTVQNDKNQRNEQNAHTSQKTGQHTDNSTANKKEEVHFFSSPTFEILENCSVYSSI